MRYFLLIFCFFMMSCSQEESQTQSPPEDQLSAVSEEEQNNAESAPETSEPSSVMEVETIVLIPRIRITCRGWFLPNYKDLTCERGTPVCGRRASADPSSEPKPYCVIGDPEEAGVQLTMIPPEVASPYCKDVPFKFGDGGKIECFEYHGDE